MSIFDIKPTKKHIEAFCFNQGIEAFVHGDYTKRGVAVNAFFGLTGLESYHDGFNFMCNFELYFHMIGGELKGGDKKW